MNNKVKKLVITALLAAMTTVATLLIQIPTPTKGYVNLGDCLVNISAWLLGPFYGAAAGGIGSAMADIMSGYVIYAPATLTIKSGMAVAAYYVYKALSGKSDSIAARAVAAAASELIMTFGYCAYEAVLSGSISAAIAGIPANLIQGSMGAVTSVFIYEAVIKRIPKNLFSK